MECRGCSITNEHWSWKTQLPLSFCLMIAHSPSSPAFGGVATPEATNSRISAFIGLVGDRRTTECAGSLNKQSYHLKASLPNIRWDLVCPGRGRTSKSSGAPTLNEQITPASRSKRVRWKESSTRDTKNVDISHTHSRVSYWKVGAC